MITIRSSELDHPDGVWFAPDLDDNRERPEPERAAMLLVPMSAREFQAHQQSQVLVTKKRMKDVGAYVERREFAVKLKCLDARVKDVRNWFVEDKSGKRELKTWAELRDALLGSADAVHLAVINEIFGALVEHSALEDGALRESV